MGCLFAALLKKAGFDAELLAKDHAKAEMLANSGVTLESKGNSGNYKVAAHADPARLENADLVLLCVKAYDTKKAAETLAANLAPGAKVLSLQNGAGNVEALVAKLGAERVLGGTTAQGANLRAPGHVIHAGAGDTAIGEPGGGTEAARDAAELLTRAGVETRTAKDLDALVWSKLAVNAAINPLTALLGVNNGALAELEQTRELMKRVTGEVLAVCAAKGTALLFPDPWEKAMEVARATAPNVSSMLSDIRNGRRTEIGHINGAIAREGDVLGVDAPVNRTLAALVEARERVRENR